MQVNENVIKMLDVDFLCVSPKLRNCGMAQTLIKEITRRSTILGIEQATFTSSRLVPKPVTEVHYYHRPLNFKKLLEIGFCHLDKSKDVEHVNKLYSLPDNSEEQFIEMMPEHLDMVFDLFNEYNDRYNFYPKYSKDEFSYWILNSNVRAYVYVENNVVKDFISYYILPSKIKNDSNRNINCAYLYYYSSVNLTIYKLFTNLMVEAKNNNIDVINLTTIMENKLILEACNCVEGTGSMFYYLYNYKIPDLRSNQIAKITL
jgi:glycylpeptide N-tetradecanoyltransferase